MLLPGSALSAIGDVSVLEHLAEPVAVYVEGSGEVRFTSPWSALTGHATVLPASAWLDLMHPDDTSAAQRLLDPGASAASAVVRLRDRDGAVRTLAMHARPVELHGRRAVIAQLRDAGDEEAMEEHERLLRAVNRAFLQHDDPDRLVAALLDVIVPLFADYAVVDLFDDEGRFERFAFAGPPELRDEIARSRERFRADGAPPGTSWDVALHGRPLYVAHRRPSEAWDAQVWEFNRRLGVRSAIVTPMRAWGRTLGAMAVARTEAWRPDFRERSIAFYEDIGTRITTAFLRARAARDVQRSEQLFRSLADEMPQIVGLTDAQGRIYFLNRRSTEYSGIPLTERSGDGWSELIHPDDRAGLQQAWAETVASGERLETRYRMRRHDGVYRWFLNQAVPVHDASGAIVSWIGTATDIDDLQRRENLLRAAVEVGDIFAATLDTTEALRRLGNAAIRYVAEWCGIYLFDKHDGLRPLVIAHADPARVDLVRHFLQRYPIEPDSGLMRAAQFGETERIGPIPDSAYDVIEDPERRAMARALDLGAIMNVPLAVGDERFGVLSLALGTGAKRVFDDDDEQLAHLLAQRAAIALANARLYERQRVVAQTLQSAFLPSVLPRQAGLAFDAQYVPSSSDITVGGDWYDADVRDDGIITFSIGDVAGHDLDSAVPMSKMRQTLRVLTTAREEPAAAMLGADAVLRREHDDVFATAFCAVFDPATGSLRYSNAGHPPPFVRERDGTVRRFAPAGVPLGLAHFVAPTTHVDCLADDALLVAMTDGLLELTRDIGAGEAAVARELAHPAFAICSTPAALLRARMIVRSPADDVAILTMRYGSGADWSFDSNDASAAARARGSVVRSLRALGFDADALAIAELIVGEVIGNAFRYAPGVVDLAVHERDGHAVVCALDRGPGLEWRATRPHDESESGRGLYLIDRLARAVHCESLAGFGTYLEITLQR